LSFRLGGTDGVGVEAAKWAWALEQLGFTTRRVAGELDGPTRDGDVVLPWLAIGAADRDASEPDLAALADALDGSDLIVVENICSLPLNLNASRLTARVLAGCRGRVLFHHHDLPWQRRAYAELSGEFPPRVPGALHVTVNLRSRRELLARGHEPVVTFPNRFDLDAPTGERDATRAAFGFTDEELVVFQPARAIERKNVPGGVRFASELARAYPERAVRYWLSGPAEDGYGPTLQRILERAPVPMTIGRAPSAADGYAAADVVVVPSTWEGFGNPTIESIVARRPLAAFAYPVLSEILATGLRFFSTSDPAALARFLREPDELQQRFFDVNLHRARLSYSLADLPKDLDRAFTEHGWTAW
jgi:glycosyltransferase involved in cell wall biosynthesis